MKNSKRETVQHPINPLYNKNSAVLILGSFPSQKSREQAFFYAHKQNRFWVVLAKVFGAAVPETVEQKKAFLLSHGVALWDVIASCEIAGSADSTIKNVIPNDISVITNSADIKAIFVNGKTAARCYDKYIKPSLGREAVCLPSTSPANAAWTEEMLLKAWQTVAERAKAL